MIEISLSGATPSIELSGIGKEFSGVRALAGISFRVTGTGVIGIIGPNGSGKSTLLGILSGLASPSVGTYRIGGRDVTRMPAAVLASDLRVSRSFQHTRLVPELRCWENVAVGFRRRATGLGLAWRKERARAIEQMERVGVAHVADRWPANASAADHKRIEIARALARDPRVMLLDEPAAGLSEADSLDFISAVLEASKTALVVLVEHNLHIIDAASSHVLVLIGGELVACDTPQAVSQLDIVRTAYLGVGAS
jgi:ABC-type branched-subunit amino acid transport system ATPase component